VKMLDRINLKFLSLAVLALMVTPARLFACAACYGQSDAPMARGLTWAILALGGIIACVLSGVVVFFVHTGKKSASIAKAEAATAETDQRNL